MWYATHACSDARRDGALLLSQLAYFSCTFCRKAYLSILPQQFRGHGARPNARPIQQVLDMSHSACILSESATVTEDKLSTMQSGMV